MQYLFEERPPFMKVVTPKIQHLSENKASMALEFKEDYIGNLRIPCLHGGVVTTLVDHCSGFCAWSTLRDPSTSVSTVDIRVDFLAPA
jgi:acyl-coenzyme A thioesterase PaaI-like protein